MKVRIENNKNIQTMEQKDIDIYEILKDMPADTELYTPLSGKVGLSYIALNKEAGEAILVKNKGGEYSFNKNGRWMEGGEVLLFPSNEMRDWSKFFKKGDVLVSNDSDSHIIFKGFSKNDYTTFEGEHWISASKKRHISCLRMRNVQDYHIEDNKDSAQTYINAIEKFCGGKLNWETLEIEKPQPEFKDGDIVVAEEDNYYDKVIFIATIKDDIVSKALINVRYEDYEVHYNEYRFGHNRSLRLATDSEKQQLFEALAKENKAWDAEKKQIVDLKPVFEVGKLYVFKEEDEDGELTIIGKLIDKNESEDTLTFGNQYEIENEKFVTDQTFDLRISVNKELREATDDEYCTFREAYYLWEKSKEKKSKEQSAFKPFDKVLVSNGEGYNWQPAFFVSDRGEGASYRYKVLPIQSGKVADFAQCIPYEGNESIAFTDYDIENLPF